MCGWCHCKRDCGQSRGGATLCYLDFSVMVNVCMMRERRKSKRDEGGEKNWILDPILDIIWEKKEILLEQSTCDPFYLKFE